MLFRRRVLVTAVTLVGVTLSWFTYQELRQSEERQLLTEFSRRADVRNALTQEVISNFESGLFGLGQLFTASDRVSREEFVSAAQAILARYPGISALEWVSIVSEADRAAVEAGIALETGHPFEFKAPQSDGSMQRAPNTVEHYPIVYVEPITGNERALGYDLAHGPTLAAIQHACATGEMTITRPFLLIQETADQPSVVLIYPVFKIRDNGPHCIGFAQGVFRIHDILQRGLGRTGGKTVDILYLDPAGTSPESRLLFYHTATPVTGRSIEAEFRAGLLREKTLTVANRSWTALYRPNPVWFAESHSRAPLWLFFSGLAMTGLLASLIHILGRRHEAIEREVQIRTTELNESRSLLEGLMRALPGMAFRRGPGDPGTVLYLNDGVFSLTEYTRDDFISGRINYRDIIHPDDLERVRQVTGEALKNKTPFDLEYRFRTKSGVEKWGLSRGQGVYDDRGQLLYYEGLVIEITQRKQAEADKLLLERRLLESQKLESLGQLAGGVAHDFNNLLTSILGNSGLARLDLPEGSPASNCLRQVEVASQQAAELCLQMLSFAGRGHLALEPIQISDLLESMEPLLRSSVGRKTALDFQLATDLPPFSGDASQIRQAAMNLIVNASEAYGDRGGTVTIRTSVRDYTAAELSPCVINQPHEAGRYVILEVSDRGDGIPPQFINRIFDPFFTTKFAGRGLGLAAVHGILKGHHAALLLETHPDKGSRFTALFPVMTQTRAESTTAAPTTGQHRTALVIDDDLPVCEVMAELLRTLDYDTVTATSGEEGLALFQGNHAQIDLVILDFVMPGLTGPDTLEHLRAIKPEIRVLMMSGHDESKRLHQLAIGGPVAYIGKPFNRASLSEVLRKLFTI